MTEQQEAEAQVEQQAALPELTGEQVQAFREEHKLSRIAFARMCGYDTGSRIWTIENKNGWKPGDLEKVHAGMRKATASPDVQKKAKRSKNKEESRARADALQAKLEANGHALHQGEDEVASGYDPFVQEVNDEEFIGGATFSLDSLDAATDDLTAAVFDGSFHDALADAEEQQLVTLPVSTAPAYIPVADVKLLTNSEIGTWQRCRRKWWLAIYRQLSLRARDYTDARSTGTRVHRALAAWYVPEGETRVDPREALERIIVDDWTAIVNQFNSREHAGDRDQALGELADRFNAACALERAMIEGYVQWLEETGADANLEVIAPEATVGGIIEGSVTNATSAHDMVKVQVMGKLDVRMRRRSDGVRLFTDHKTAGDLTSPRKTLHMDPQMLHYHLLEFLNSEEGDERCDGAIYNMLRKVKRTQRANPPFYDRIEVRHNQFEIDAYRRRLLGLARDIQRATDELMQGGDPMSITYPNPTKNCSWDCDFFPVCPMFDDGSRAEDALSSLYHQVDPLQRYDLVDTEI